MIHHLTEKDPELRRAVCSVCGSTDIKPAGRGWRCATKSRLDNRLYFRDHPERRSKKESAHRLEDGECAMCGPVQPVPYGRGWACPNGTTRRQANPNLCRDCLDVGDRVDLVDGWCPRCSRSLNQILLDEADTHRQLAAAGLGDWSGFSLVGGWLDPEYMPDYETAVPGWKTLGRRTPAVTGA